MKLLTTFTALTLLFTLQFMESRSTQQSITASVKNITTDEGKVFFALYSKETFMKSPLQAKNAIIEKGVSTVVFENVAPGEYAVICFHDRNNNNKMDFEPSGMPMEDYGISNNYQSFGPPRFDDGKFVVADAPIILEIKF